MVNVDMLKKFGLGWKMHTLLLLRHAKSDWSVPVGDHKRPLNKRGSRDAPVMAKRVKKRGYRPDMILSSSALRAVQTAEAFAKALKSEPLFDDRLYDAHENTIIDLIHAMEEEIKDLMLVGHNPTWESVVEYLTGERIVMPTCSMVQIAFDCHWKELKATEGKIVYFDYPKKEL